MRTESFLTPPTGETSRDTPVISVVGGTRLPRRQEWYHRFAQVVQEPE